MKLDPTLSRWCFRSSLAYAELEERLELLEASMAPVSPHMEERVEMLEALLSRAQVRADTVQIVCR